MTLRAKLLLIILAIVIAIAALIALISFSRKPAEQSVVQNSTAPVADQNSQSNTPTPAAIAPPTPSPTLPKPTNEETDIIAISLPFVERFGSYSNQSGYENYKALLPFMTKDMQDWANKTISDAAKQPFQELYKGITTKSLSYTVTSSTASTKEVRVSTQRKESVGTATNSKVYTQDIILTLKKEDGIWLVQAAQWQ